MSKRKAVPKKLRFEIFKRDGFKCVYCGRTPPIVILQIDHIEPVSKGGCNNNLNLVTSCQDCNLGKGADTLSSVPESLAESIKTIKEREFQLKEYAKFIKSVNKRINRDIEAVNKIYKDRFVGWRLSDTFRQVTVKKFLERLPLHEVQEAMYIAIGKINKSDQAIRYFCGICWNKIREIENKQ